MYRGIIAMGSCAYKYDCIVCINRNFHHNALNMYIVYIIYNKYADKSTLFIISHKANNATYNLSSFLNQYHTFNYTAFGPEKILYTTLYSKNIILSPIINRFGRKYYFNYLATEYTRNIALNSII